MPASNCHLHVVRAPVFKTDKLVTLRFYLDNFIIPVGVVDDLRLVPAVIHVLNEFFKDIRQGISAGAIIPDKPEDFQQHVIFIDRDFPLLLFVQVVH